MAEVDIMYGEGISSVGEIVDIASEHDIINKSGSWYSYQDEKIGQGRENAKKFLIANPKMLEEVDNKVRTLYGIGDGTPVEKAAEEPEA